MTSLALSSSFRIVPDWEGNSSFNETGNVVRVQVRRLGLEASRSNPQMSSVKGFLLPGGKCRGTLLLHSRHIHCTPVQVQKDTWYNQRGDGLTELYVRKMYHCK